MLRSFLAVHYAISEVPTLQHLPATCVRICMLFCSAASGSLYSPAFPNSTSSSFTFTWFSRSRNNLRPHAQVSLPSFIHTKGTLCIFFLFQLTSLLAPEIVFPDPTSHPDTLLSSAHSPHRPSLHRKETSCQTHYICLLL